MANNLLFRGNVTPKDISISLCRIKEKRIYRFVDWMPTGTRLGISYRGGPKVGVIAECERSVCFLSNSTTYLGVLERLKAGAGERENE
jgi:tubulin alpha